MLKINLNTQLYEFVSLKMTSKIQLCGKAYATVIYDEVFANLIAVKIENSPLNHQTLPRIELFSALLLTKLCPKVMKIK